MSLSLQNKANNIIKHLDFDEKTSVKELISAINHFKSNNGIINANAPSSFLTTAEEKIILDSEGKIRVSLYKILLFIKITESIKSGSLNLKYSYQYKAIQNYLIDKDYWDTNREKLLSMSGLSQFTDVNKVLNELKDKLEDQYSQVNVNINNQNNNYIRFDDEEQFNLITPNRDRNNTEALRSIFSEAGFIPIIQVLKDVNNATNFVEDFKHYSTKHHKLKPDIDTIIAGIMGYGHNIGINKMGDISIGVNSNTLRQVSNWFFINKNLTAANNRIIAMIDKLALSKIFRHDQITHTASDGRKVGVAVDCLLANYSFKYFGKDKGVTVYTFLDNKQSLYYSTVFSSSEREAAYVMDGLLHNEVVKSVIHSTDTYGFMESVFTATHFIGTSFAPRIKNIKKQTIYGFSAKQTYKKRGYKILPSRTINQKLIIKHWDDILRFMATIKLKKATASQLFKRLSSYAKDHPLYKAIKEFGRIIKSMFILNYIDDVELRQKIELQLNRVELSNKFGRAVFFANSREFRVATKEEQEIVTSCKMLIQNAIVLWNYLYLSNIFVANKNPKERDILLNNIRYGSLLAWAHINMQGEYDFRIQAANSSIFDMDKILSLKLNIKAA